MLNVLEEKRGCGIVNKNYFEHLKNANGATLEKFVISCEDCYFSIYIITITKCI